eukprot:scaffold165414_cov36-Tisochrysis_lutea.AAC.1
MDGGWGVSRMRRHDGKRPRRADSHDQSPRSSYRARRTVASCEEKGGGVRSKCQMTKWEWPNEWGHVGHHEWSNMAPHPTHTTLHRTRCTIW